MNEEEVRKYLQGMIISTRKELGLTKGAAARRMGTTWSYYNRIEKGESTPGIRTLIRVAEALEVELVLPYFINENDNDD